MYRNRARSTSGKGDDFQDHDANQIHDGTDGLVAVVRRASGGRKAFGLRLSRPPHLHPVRQQPGGGYLGGLKFTREGIEWRPPRETQAAFGVLGVRSQGTRSPQRSCVSCARERHRRRVSKIRGERWDARNSVKVPPLARRVRFPSTPPRTEDKDKTMKEVRMKRSYVP